MKVEGEVAVASDLLRTADTIRKQIANGNAAMVAHQAFKMGAQFDLATLVEFNPAVATALYDGKAYQKAQSKKALKSKRALYAQIDDWALPVARQLRHSTPSTSKAAIGRALSDVAMQRAEDGLNNPGPQFDTSYHTHIARWEDGGRLPRKAKK